MRFQQIDIADEVTSSEKYNINDVSIMGKCYDLQRDKYDLASQNTFSIGVYCN